MDSEKKKTEHDITNGIQVGIGILGLVGLLIFGWPSPANRPKIFELYLAGVWGLIALSGISAYWTWKQAPWPRRLMAIAAPLAALLYLQKYFMG